MPGSRGRWLLLLHILLAAALVTVTGARMFSAAFEEGWASAPKWALGLSAASSSGPGPAAATCITSHTPSPVEVCGVLCMHVVYSTPHP